MESTFWLKQTVDHPLFSDLLWSRPENRQTAGKLLIIGGNLHGFAAAAMAYGAAEKAKIGTVRVLLPDRLQKTVSKAFPPAEYAASTPAGSFSQAALAEFLDLSQWADGVLLAGDFGKNSETSVLLERFVEKYAGLLTLTQDSLDYFLSAPQTIIDRQTTTLLPDFYQLQKIFTSSNFTEALTSDMGLVRMTGALHLFSQIHSCAVATDYAENFVVALGGLVSSTKKAGNHDSLNSVSASVATWSLQNPSRQFEALSTSFVS